MNNFSFKWFLTTPGILTCLGVLLMLISIIIFIATLRGNKKKGEGEQEANPQVIGQTPDANGTPVVTETPVAVAQNPPTLETATPVAPVVTPTPVAPQAPEPVAPTSLEPAVTPTTPQVEPVTPVMPQPEVTPSAGAEPQPITLNNVAPVTPTIDAQPAITPATINIVTPPETPVAPTIAPSVPPVAPAEPALAPQVEVPQAPAPTIAQPSAPTETPVEAKKEDIESL